MGARGPLRTMSHRRVSLSITPGLVARLQIIAATDGTAFCQTIRNLLSEALDARDAIRSNLTKEGHE
jgi:hypothetical protein